MCGIAGILTTIGDAKFHKKHYQQVAAILEDQKYRGPDHQYIDSILTANFSLTLGHNRLNIVDLQPGSNQPMWDESKRFILAYNGMLYNYKELRDDLQKVGFTFFSNGDTEVVLKSFMHWGMEAFNRFNGMFAIAIFDSKDQILYLIRDRFGIKPLFYFYQPDRIYFASTTSELAYQLKLAPNMTYLGKGLNYWCYDHEDESAYQDLLMVSPGEIITISLTNQLKFTKKKYYFLSENVQSLIATQLTESSERLIDKTHFLLQDAIDLRLRSDVPIGLSLSGGIDSATVASMAQKKSQSLTAFSFGSLENAYSEANNAKLSADKIGCNLHFVSPSFEKMNEAFLNTLLLQDAPFPNFSIVAQYLVFDAARQQNIKVMLGGQGGDEIFMGYRKYQLLHLMNLLKEKKITSAALFILQLMPSLKQELKNIKSTMFNLKRYARGFSNSRWDSVTPNINLQSNGSFLWERQLHDISTTSLPTLLRYEDRNSMGNSIESRLPFLDYRLVELALSLPETLKLHRGYSKWILRKISSSYIPSSISFARQKRGFDVDNRIWIEAGVGNLMRNILNSNQDLLKQMGLSNQVNHLFSDRRLCGDSFSLAECITLTWLAQKKHFSWS